MLALFEKAVQKVCNRLLPAIIVYLNRFKSSEIKSMPVDKFRQLALKRPDDRFRIIGKPLVHDKTSVLKRNMVRKRKHAVEYLAPKIPIHEHELVVRMDDRPRMKVEVGDTDRIKLAIKPFRKLRN